MSLAYFKWYPGDAENDEVYASLSDEELGFYHRCLNKAWANGGLPGDMRELARMLKVDPRQVKRLWAKVSRAWRLEGGRWVNPRQEKERKEAQAVSEGAQKAIKTRWENAQLPETSQGLLGDFSKDPGGLLESSDGLLKRSGSNFPANALKTNKTADTNVIRPRNTAIAIARESARGAVGFDVEARFDALYARHVYPGFVEEGRHEYVKVMESAVYPEREADLIDEAHRVWTKYYNEHPEAFRPGIGRWLKEGYFTKLPPGTPAKTNGKPIDQSKVIAYDPVRLAKIREEDLAG